MRMSGLICGDIALLLAGPAGATGLWSVYQQAFAHAKYIDLTHTIAPTHSRLARFCAVHFRVPTLDPQTRPARTRTRSRRLRGHAVRRSSTDQLGTQLDPPAHWAPEYPAIDELPRDLFGAAARRHLDRASRWQKQSRLSPPGRRHPAVGSVPWPHPRRLASSSSARTGRSDWPDPALATRAVFPGVSLDALQFLHLRAPYPVPRPRTARHRHDADAGRRVLADA